MRILRIFFMIKKKKKLLKLVYRKTFFLNDGEIPILRDDKKEDAGHFFEYFIGKSEYGFYSEIIEILIINDININFILNVEMWNKKIDIMR